MEIFEKNPNPTKDQHFLTDDEILSQIYETAGVMPGESIIEIGGGAGAITDYLASGKNYVTVIEKDPYYASFLKDRYSNKNNVNVIEGDALQYSFNDYDRLVSNLPYTITEPLLINLASSGALDYNPSDPKASKIKSITLVVSQNSLRKMLAPIQITEGNSKHFNQEFGIMSAISKVFFDIDIIGAIPSSAFYPEPAVTSFIINLTPKKEKTTVDRIIREMLIDKKGVRPSVKKVYELLLVQNKIYKTGKHKNSTVSTKTSITSKNIENRNIYDLTNAQLSQLIQDLIRNDISIKSRNNSVHREIDYRELYSLNKFVFEDDYDEYDDIEELNRSKSKYERKYDYMYDQTKYDVLLHRGLENMDPYELQEMLGNMSVNRLILKK